MEGFPIMIGIGNGGPLCQEWTKESVRSVRSETERNVTLVAAARRPRGVTAKTPPAKSASPAGAQATAEMVAVVTGEVVGRDALRAAVAVTGAAIVVRELAGELVVKMVVEVAAAMVKTTVRAAIGAVAVACGTIVPTHAGKASARTGWRRRSWSRICPRTWRSRIWIRRSFRI